MSRQEGFFPVQNLHYFDMPIGGKANDISSSVHRLVMGKGPQDASAATGTAFSIRQDGLLLTNVHNIQECLKSLGLERTGYRNESGPIRCPNLWLIDSSGQAHDQVYLIASNPSENLHETQLDFAVLQVRALAGKVIAFQGVATSLKPGEQVFIVGYPAATSRNKKSLQDLKKSQLSSLGNVAVFSDFILAADPSRYSVADLRAKWWSLFRQLDLKSNFLAAAALNDFDTIATKPDIDSTSLLSALRDWCDTFVRSADIFVGALDAGLRRRADDPGNFLYPDANGGKSLTFAKISPGFTEKVVLMEGDAMKGSSGSPVLNSSGRAVGILNAIDESRGSGALSPCQLDLLATSDESWEYSYCDEARVQMIPAVEIVRTLLRWGIQLPTAE